MDLKILEQAGLSHGEAQVYVSLLELGRSKAGAILQKTGLQNSVVHLCLNRLIAKGLVSIVVKGRMREYQAASPKNIAKALEDKKRQFEAILPELLAKEKNTAEQQFSKMFSGFSGVTSLLNEMIEDAMPKQEFLFFAVNVGELDSEVQDFFRKFDLKRKQKKLETKGIAHKPLRPLFAGRPVKMRYVDFPIPKNISVCNDKIAILDWGEKPVGFLLKSKQIAAIIREFFHSSWEKAEKRF